MGQNPEIPPKWVNLGSKYMLSNQVKPDSNLLSVFRRSYKLPVYGGDPLEGSSPRFRG